MRFHLAVAMVVGAMAMLHVASAEAQLNNQPFSFGSGGGGIGMSTAGRQAILNQQLFGSTPDNILMAYLPSLMYCSAVPR